MKVTNEQAVGRDVARNFRQLNAEVEAIDARLVTLDNQGLVVRASKTANQTTITTIVDVSGLSVTFTATASRLYKIEAQGLMFSSAADNLCQLTIADSANAVVATAATMSRSTTLGTTIRATGFLSGISGSVTYKVRAARLSGAGNLTFVASATSPGLLWVEDVGTV
jgi:hypothetical protein